MFLCLFLVQVTHILERVGTETTYYSTEVNLCHEVQEYVFFPHQIGCARVWYTLFKDCNILVSCSHDQNEVSFFLKKKNLFWLILVWSVFYQMLD